MSYLMIPERSRSIGYGPIPGGRQQFGADQRSLGQFLEDNPGLRLAWGLLSTASMAVSAFHGYKRNDSVGWAIWWGLMGALFPVITPVIAVAQGFGKRKRG